MTRLLSIAFALCLVVQSPAPATAPHFENGLAQPVFANGPIVRHSVWVEVPGLDTDRDTVNDRIRVQITRPDATGRGTKLPVIMVASLGLDRLKAIVPIAGVSSYYDHRRSYGTVINSFPAIGTDADTLFDNILSRQAPDACAWMRERIAIAMDRETGDYNAFWDERNYVKDVGKFKTAVLISHGLNDFNVKPRHAARLWAALKAHAVPAKIWWHQGGHGDRANSARGDAWRETLNRFWSHHLFGVQNGVMAGPRALVEREDHAWVEYADWPVPGSEAVRVRFAPGPVRNAIGRLGVQGRQPAAEETIVDDSSIDANALVAAAASPHRLIYQTAPLTVPLHISGIPSVSLRMSFDRPAAIVSAMLIDINPTGAPAIITRGWADPQNRESIARTTDRAGHGLLDRLRAPAA